MTLPFNLPHLTGRELDYMKEALVERHLSGDGRFTKRCHSMLAEAAGVQRALLTHSCTAALEMAAMLADLKPGDEVIMPSFTFVSTANAVVLRGARPVFVDVRPDTFNLDEALVRKAITDKTRAILPVHYAGVGCDMDAILSIATDHDLLVIEDAAQAFGSTYKGRALGGIGDMGALSFHETKNVVSGEGGALLLRDDQYVQRAEIIREKGTNRSAFFRGQVDKYTWVDVGSSYLPSELLAAFLYAQLEGAAEINRLRLETWNRYDDAFRSLEFEGYVRRPRVPVECHHNAHMYYLLLPSLTVRERFISELKANGVSAVFHYIPLHSSPAGQAYGRVNGDLSITNAVSDQLVRLPLWADIGSDVDEVISAVEKAARLALAATDRERDWDPARLFQA